MDAVIFGNVTLDIICYPVNDVPRHESISFDDVTISPGGCASNTAIGLAALGVPTTIVARTGNDEAAEMLFNYWERVGLDHRFVQRVRGNATGTSIGLVDDNFQPRFVHSPGTNSSLSAELIDPPEYAAMEVKHFHIAGFFVLPNLFNQLAEKLAEIRNFGITTSLDVVFNVRMDDPKLQKTLWEVLPHLDYFTANAYEVFRLTGEEDYKKAADVLLTRGAHNIIIKLGERGCYILSPTFSGIIPGIVVEVVDTTGAGDAFTAGFISALVSGREIDDACRMGNQAGAKICTKLGAIAAWFDEK
jgi:sugar/nucleoside kinase (ribokinase family)